MNLRLRHLFCFLLPAVVLTLTGCGGTTIKSDLVLETSGRARLQLEQRTESIELFNDSSCDVRIRVLDRKDRVLTNMTLSANEQVSLEIENARAVQFDNAGDKQAIVRWILRNNDRIEYSLAMTPTD